MNRPGVIDGADPNVLEAVGYAIGVIATSIAALSVASSVLSSVKSLFKVLGTLKGAGFRTGWSNRKSCRRIRTLEGAEPERIGSSGTGVPEGRRYFLLYREDQFRRQSDSLQSSVHQ